VKYAIRIPANDSQGHRGVADAARRKTESQAGGLVHITVALCLPSTPTC
jgi:hypothetical protein